MTALSHKELVRRFSELDPCYNQLEINLLHPELNPKLRVGNREGGYWELKETYKLTDPNWWKIIEPESLPQPGIIETAYYEGVPLIGEPFLPHAIGITIDGFSDRENLLHYRLPHWSHYLNAVKKRVLGIVDKRYVLDHLLAGIRAPGSKEEKHVTELSHHLSLHRQIDLD